LTTYRPLDDERTTVTRSTDRILTTHTGSLPRPSDLVQLMFAKQQGREVDEDMLRGRITEAVRDVVARQAEVGIDVVSDGEASKPSYASYVAERLTGFGGESVLPRLQDLVEYPEVAKACFGDPGNQVVNEHRPACNGPVALADSTAVEADIANFAAALDGRPVEQGFITAASPGLISCFLGNTYYPSEEAFLAALVEAMRPEYEAIVDAGFLLQLDCPDLAMAGHREYAHRPLEDFRASIRLHVEALNEATAHIPPERMRMHLCWGNYPGPHHHDVPLADIVDLVLEARPAAIAFEAANPRHEHEWTVFERVELPDGKVLIPGVVDSVSNYIEHPDLIAQRLLRYAGIVGKENVMAGSDCGFGTFVGVNFVDPGVTWQKLGALVEGARRASEQLW
jgi:5-methyltetrahydropteroyltriglutamate--homocysteine methyltransferase